MATNIISQEELKALLHYDPETGVFTWKVDRTGGTKAGTIAGRICTSGYIQIKLYNTPYMAHRLAWLYMFNIWPKLQIDHINGIRTDNKLCNLREASNAENLQNTKLYENNKTGYIGVSLHKNTNKYRACIRVNNVLKHLGLFSTPELAYEAYLKAKAELHEFQPTPR